jgi:hypothetical protein
MVQNIPVKLLHADPDSPNPGNLELRRNVVDVSDLQWGKNVLIRPDLGNDIDVRLDNVWQSSRKRNPRSFLHNEDGRRANPRKQLTRLDN